jgi:hypothetical protein
MLILGNVNSRCSQNAPKNVEKKLRYLKLPSTPSLKALISTHFKRFLYITITG